MLSSSFENWLCILSGKITVTVSLLLFPAFSHYLSVNAIVGICNSNPPPSLSICPTYFLFLCPLSLGSLLTHRLFHLPRTVSLPSFLLCLCHTLFSISLLQTHRGRITNTHLHTHTHRHTHKSHQACKCRLTTDK